MKGKYPIVAILKLRSETDLTNINLSSDNFEFQEWGYIRAIEEMK